MFENGVTILIPTYNRLDFSNLIIHNINCQTYPYIEKIIIADDGEIPLNVSGCRYDIQYVKVSRCNIGAKRNFLKSLSKSDFSAFMDTDDFYHPNYIARSVQILLESGKQVTGSNDMIIWDKCRVYKQRCSLLNLLNEATLVFRTSYDGSFGNANSSEGKSFLHDISLIEKGPIENIMICIAHETNTVCKKRWTTKQYVTSYGLLDPYLSHMEIYGGIV